MSARALPSGQWLVFGPLLSPFYCESKQHGTNTTLTLLFCRRLLLASWLYSTCYKAKRYYYGDDRNMENEQLLTEDNGSEEKGTA